MAANSIREQIIVYIQGLLEALNSIETVVRTKQSYSDLEGFAVTQLPVAAIVGRLPVPTEKLSARIKADVDTIISKLAVDVFVYAQERVSPDTVLSNLADDLWIALYADETMGGLVLSTLLTVEEQPEYWDPYFAFMITANVKYKHGTGGI